MSEHFGDHLVMGGTNENSARPKGLGNILTVFAERVAEGPDRPAVRDARAEWTYRSLDRAANGVAQALIAKLGRGAEPVALMTEHDAGHIVARLGIQKAGKFVLSVDAQEPADRLRALLDQAGSRMVVTDGANLEAGATLAGPGREVLDTGGLGEAATAPLPPGEIESGSPCGVLYTSGSTGEPKGVLQTHHNVVWNVRNYTRGAGIHGGDRMTLLTRGHFAAASSAIYGALLNGACVYPFDPRLHGFREMRDWLNREKVTIFHSVPTLFRRFCESLDSGEQLASIRLIKLGGEPVMNYDIRLLQRHFSNRCDLLNGLGMTEANGNICHFRIPHEHRPDFAVIPVGYAVEGVEIVIVGEGGEVVASGETGEIAFRSRFLSPGYWRMGGFEQRMMRSPLGDGGEPFFATGDLGRMEADGCLVHQGRMDRLLKIRGQRVEPAVVEASLMDHPRVVRCAVAAIGSGSKEKRLAAYYVRGEGAEAGGAELREYLKERLPASHLPTWIVPVEEIPLTSNGKIDYQSLPDPTQLTEGDHTAAAARDGVELVLIRIWERVLRIKQPGVEEDFFELGGDSLLAALMLSRVEAKLKVDLPMAHFCDEATIRGLAELVRRRGSDAGYARLVPLSDGEGGLPYFSVPGAGADVAVIKTERWVPLGRPVYGMQYRGIDGVEHPHETVEEIATYLVEEIRKVQPEGPYHLGGASFGGLVAYEAARQLRGLGEETALLVLADTRVSGHAKPRKGTGIAGSVERALLRLLPVGEQVALTKDSIRGALRQARYRVSVPLMRWRCKREGRPLPKVYRFYELLNRAVAAKRRYEVKAYDGPVTLFRFSEQAPDRLFEVDPTLGWGPYCPNLEIRDLPGAHGDLGRDPEATECFYRNLKELLE